MVEKREVEEARDFFAKRNNLPRFASALARRPNLLVGLHNAARDNQVEIPRLKAIAKIFVTLGPKGQKRFEKVLSAAELLHRKRGIDEAVSLMDRFVAFPETFAFGKRIGLRLRVSRVGSFLSRLGKRVPIPSDYEVVHIPREVEVLMHDSHKRVFPTHLKLDLAGENLRIKGVDAKGSFVVSWPRASPGRIVSQGSVGVSRERKGSRDVLRVTGPGEVTLSQGHRFAVGASVFEFYATKGKQFYLRGVSGPSQGKLYIFKRSPATIGSDVKNDVILLAKKVNKK